MNHYAKDRLSYWFLMSKNILIFVLCKKNMACGKYNILSHNVVLSTPHHERDSQLALIAQVFVNPTTIWSRLQQTLIIGLQLLLLGIYDQSVVSHYYFFKYMQKPLGQYILFKTINKTLIMIFSCHVTRSIVTKLFNYQIVTNVYC
jgi:uncharacterized integral membrane protein